jgi:hypothetical protein
MDYQVETPNYAEEARSGLRKLLARFTVMGIMMATLGITMTGMPVFPLMADAMLYAEPVHASVAAKADECNSFDAHGQASCEPYVTDSW